MIKKEAIVNLVQAASLAPSGDNCQPFVFHWNGRVLKVKHVKERGEALINVQNAASWMALGMSCFNMALAANAAGKKLQITYFPEQGNDVVAHIEIEDTAPSKNSLFSNLTNRCVNRHPYLQDPFPEKLKNELEAATQNEHGIQWQCIEDRAAINSLATELGRFDRLLFENKPTHDYLYRWVRWTSKEVQQTRDGMPIDAFEVKGADKLLFHLFSSWTFSSLASTLGAARIVAKRGADLYSRSGAIGFLSLADFHPESFARLGEIWQRLWLTLTAHGFALQPLAGAPLFTLLCRFDEGKGLSAGNKSLVENIGRHVTRQCPDFSKRVPGMFLRMGRPLGAPSARTLRLPVERLLVVEETQ